MTFNETELAIVGAHALALYLVEDIKGLEKVVQPFSSDDRVIILTGALATLMGIAQAGIASDDLTRAVVAVIRRLGPLPSDEPVEGMPDL